MLAAGDLTGGRTGPVTTATLKIEQAQPAS